MKTYQPPVFTEPELDALIQLIDLGVKHGGIAVAGNAAHLHAKIKQSTPVATLDAKVSPDTSEQS